MLGCGKMMLALALLLTAAPLATMAQTTDNQPAQAGQPGQSTEPPTPSQQAQAQADPLKPEQLEALFDPDQTWKKVDAANP